jgi:hypothetical protein
MRFVQPDLTTEQILMSIWSALRRIEDNLALAPAPIELPAPMVNVAPPDLGDIVTAVTGLKPGPTADEIARAIAGVLSPVGPPTEIPGITEFNAAVKELSWRLKSVGSQAYGGGAVSFAPGQIALLSTAAGWAGTDTAAVTAIPASTSAVTAAAANTGRRGLIFYNDSADTVYLKFGSGVSSSSFSVKMAPEFTYEMQTPTYNGLITAVWSGTTGNGRVTEIA